MGRIIKPPRGALPNLLHPQARGGVAGWLLNEGTGDKIFDFFGNGNHGTLLGPTWVPGRNGPALSFNGINNFINTGSGIGNVLTGDLTISLWVNRTTKRVARDGIITIGGMDFQTFGDPNGEIAWNKTGVVEVRSTNAAIPEGERVHIALTQLGTTLNTTNTKMYVNADQKSTILAGSGTVDYIGDTLIAKSVADNKFLHGIFDEVYIYNRVLSAAEIAGLYHNSYAMFQRRIRPAMFFVPLVVAVVAARYIIPVAIELFDIIPKVLEIQDL